MRKLHLFAAMKLAVAAAMSLPFFATPAWAHDASDPKAHEHKVAAGLKVTMADYVVPDVWLVRDDGKKVTLPKELADGRPVVLNFIYTTCPGICPVMSQVFSQFQERLGADRDKVHMVSISIDPEQDTPARLRAYAQKFHAGSEWGYYTGTLAASVATQQAFSAYRGDKMSHLPVMLMRAAPGKAWLRIDGYVTPDELLQHYHELLAGL